MRGRAVAIAIGTLAVLAGCSSAPEAPSPSSVSVLGSVPSVQPASQSTPTATPTPSGPPSAIANATGWVACQCGAPPRETIYLLRADGTDEHQILAGFTGDVRHPDFSRDGQRLAFDRLPDEQSPDEIWFADAGGSNPKKIETTCPIKECLGIWEPAWSPDGKQLAAIIFGGPFANNDVSSFVVAIVDVPSGRTRKIIEQVSAKGQLQFPRWSPDGKSIAFWNETDTPSTWIVGADGKGLRELTGPDLGAGDPDWSPDGTRLVVSTRPLVHFDSGPSDLYLVDPDGTPLTKLTDSAGLGVRYTQPRWSPDGTAILYTRDMPGRVRTIRAISVDGKSDGPIPATEPFQTHPVLQPTP